jgi:polyphosphate glucokinase
MATRARPASKTRPRTLGIDVGGSHIKGAVLDPRGRMVTERIKVDTPDDLRPAKLVSIVAELARELGPFERVSVGFPGVVRDGAVRTAPNLGTERFRGFPLARKLSQKLGRPVRVANDADVQGLGAITGKGIEVVVTLGTGFGSALFCNGQLAPHLELGHHPFRDQHTYEDLLGAEGLRKRGTARWNRDVMRAIETLRALVDFDHLYIGGGNARRLTIDLPPDVSVVSNDAGIWGGVQLWNQNSA